MKIVTFLSDYAEGFQIIGAWSLVIGFIWTIYWFAVAIQYPFQVHNIILGAQMISYGFISMIIGSVIGIIGTVFK